MNRIARFLFSFSFVITLGSSMANAQAAQDFHSYANPSAVRVRHLDLDWDVNFSEKILKGTATLTVDRLSKTAPLILDTRELKIEKVETSADGVHYSPATFTLSEASPWVCGTRSPVSSRHFLR